MTSVPSILGTARGGVRKVASPLALNAARPQVLTGRTSAFSPYSSNQVRYLNLHEYQSKGLMEKYGVRVQRGEVANSAEEAGAIAQKLVDTNAKELVVKAQIHAGGRGKGHFTSGYKGGVKICDTPAEIAEAAANMIGGTLITKQTGDDGAEVQKVLVHEGISFDRELYFAILMDRSAGGPVLVVSPKGGMDIEQVAEEDPDAIHTIPVDIIQGIQPEHTEKVATLLGFTGDAFADAQQQITNLYNLFIGSDATQVEINPLVQTTDGLIYCVDAKINFDDNAFFRQVDLFKQRDYTQEDPREVAASKFDLNYIGLDGNIGCMVNGAGLAMATMDIIKLHGGSPANFLDVGGSATEEQVEAAFKILNDDPSVSAILVNIFGGIMRCDVIAQGIVNAAKNINLELPLVVRLEGTNVEKGNAILAESGITIVTAEDLDAAAVKAVKALN
jgi:succinyl-CoA synthetase beta subunit